MKVLPLKRESLRDAVIRTIEEALLNGELRPGDRIIESDLAEQAGISRGPVREAIRQLIGEGVLVGYPSHGTFVAQWGPHAVEEAYTLRAVLERLAIERASERATPEEIDGLQSTVDEMGRQAQQGDIRALVRLDVRFHEQLYALSQHALLQRTLSQLRRQLYCLLAMDSGFALHRTEIAADHQLIIDLLRDHNTAQAAAAIEAHVIAAGREVVAQVQESAHA